MSITHSQTPIIDALVEHAAREKVSMHMPGHHQGRVLPVELSNWLGQATKLDVTELAGLDNYHEASGCILQSQALAASYYGSDYCLYSVNGATACVMAAIAACVDGPLRRRIVFVGPCHVSAWRGLVYADAHMQFVPSTWRSDLQTFDRPDVRQIEGALREHDDVAAVIVTSPSYQGLVAPIREIADLAHRYNVPLIVDEAHGAHFGLCEGMPPHSVQEGADIVIQSPHKTLPCLTQGAWVHLQGDRVSYDALQSALLFLQSTSPSYLLLAALDGAQAWLRGPGKLEAEKTLARLAEFRQLEGQGRDPMRLWIPTGSEQASHDLADRMQAQGVFLEYADASGVLAMFGFSQPDYEYKKFFRVLHEWQGTGQSPAAKDGEVVQALYEMAGQSSIACLPSEVARSRKRRIPLSEANNEILAAPLAPYPPGVPALWPGHVLQSAHITRLRAWLSHGGVVLGIDENEQVEVVDGN
ncbi:aminotransferase class I/II-fold pyridoxal phosphate-dependent enzyme [Alicyclobacillus dauci]|uniref:Aminotransferase class I/II-fold pyridoxal phosphate-dependent enzyme n=1 Tax=Alicyclobacillus dauci TaxID=1475485 RepID=A0ABY6Z463_9BACL|nr:aminotransferase class I/II-fold pyridoxal phosphate-dependent enzyme [Alicyclobacillus dauci]WAH37308.1 aminotransferase class I/II-fold pyridoxal phosphate-dependent enzyme [Alicyclobacillus dauci]